MNIYSINTTVKSAMIDFTYLNNPTLYVGLLKHLHLLTCIEDLAIT